MSGGHPLVLLTHTRTACKLLMSGGGEGIPHWGYDQLWISERFTTQTRIMDEPLFNYMAYLVFTDLPIIESKNFHKVRTPAHGMAHGSEGNTGWSR